MSFLRRLLGLSGHLFGDDAYLAGISIRTSPVKQRWRPGRHSTEIKALANAKKASNQSLAALIARERAAAHRAGITALGPSLKPGSLPPPGKPGITALGPTRPPARTPAQRAHGMMGLTRHFLDGMGDAGVYDPGAAAGGGTTTPTGNCPPVIDPVTQLPLPPCWSIDPSGNLVPPPDPAPPKNADGTPYTGNSQVWVSSAPVQMFWDPEGVYFDAYQTSQVGKMPTPYQQPVLYPDGSPVVGQLWLPKLNLQQLNPQVFKPFVVGAVWGGNYHDWCQPGTNVDAQGTAYFYGGSPNSSSYPNDPLSERPGYRWKGTASIDGNLYQKVAAGLAQAPWGPVTPWGPIAQIESGKGGHATVYYLQASFDWSVNDPTTQAYPFLYQWLQDDFIHWQVMPADLWLSNGQPVSNAPVNVTLPYQPSALLHNLDFLDSLATGNHGMPQVLNWGTGTLDFPTLVNWCSQQSDNHWQTFGQVVAQAQSQPFLVATIYDVTQVQLSPGNNATQPVPAAPTPPLQPPPPLVNPSTGMQYPIDPVSGLPFDPTTGTILDPTTGQPVPGMAPVPPGTPGYTGAAGAPGYPGYPNTGPLPPGYPGYPEGGGGGYLPPGVYDPNAPDQGDYGDPYGPQFVGYDDGGGYGYGYGYGYPPSYPYPPQLAPGVSPMVTPQLGPPMPQDYLPPFGYPAPVMPPYVDQFDVSDVPDDYQAQDLAPDGYDDPEADLYQGDYY